MEDLKVKLLRLRLRLLDLLRRLDRVEEDKVVGEVIDDCNDAVDLIWKFMRGVIELGFREKAISSSYSVMFWLGFGGRIMEDLKVKLLRLRVLLYDLLRRLDRVEDVEAVAEVRGVCLDVVDLVEKYQRRVSRLSKKEVRVVDGKA